MTESIAERLQRLTPIIEEIFRIGGSPGASIGVSYQGSTIFQLNVGFRDVENQIPPDSDTLYGIASVTKSFTGCAISQLVDQNKIHWETPVSTILRDLDSRNPEVTEKLNVMDLLTHSTGLGMSNQWWYGKHGHLLVDAADSMRYFNALPQVSGFRQKYKYSNWNFDLLGKIIENVSGVSYGTFLQHNIFDPLGMKTTSTDMATIEPGNIALPYAALDDGTPFPLEQPQIWDGSIHAAAQCIRSSVNDMLRYTNALIRAYNTEENIEPSRNLLCPLKLVRHQLQCHRVRKATPPRKGHGLGVAYAELPTTLSFGCNSNYTKKMPVIASPEGSTVLLGHGGSMAGYTSTWAFLPELEFAVVVLSNSIGLADPGGWVASLLLETVLNSPEKHDYVQLAKEAAHAHVTSTASIEERLKQEIGPPNPPKPLKSYVGRYRHPLNNFLVDIRTDAKGLQIAFQGLDSQVWRLTHLNEDTFSWMSSRNEQAKCARFTYSPANVFMIIFGTDEDGHINQLSWPHEGGVPEDEQVFIRQESRFDAIDEHDGMKVQKE